MSEEAGPSAATVAAPARVSGRNKVKSQRAIESEDNARMFAAAKAKQKADAEAIARGEDVKPASASETGTKPRVSRGASASTKGKSKGKGKGKAKKEELYCVCKKPSDDDDGPMIECAECNDWYHFACIELAEDEAERIHNYVCPDCTEATGEKTTMMYDISTFKSPSPADGRAPASAKRKAAKSATAKSQITSVADDSGSGDEVDDPPETSSSDSDSGSDAAAPQPRQIKRPRSSKEPSQKPTSDVKPTIPRPRPPPPAKRTSTAILPKARLFVIDKFTELVKSMFGSKLDEEGVHRYAKNLEESLFEAFKDGQESKAVAGGRYKTQFTLIDRSLPKARPELLAEITSFQLPAAKVALLTSADLATAERLEELEKAKKAALEQTVKQKEYSGAIRMGRDGFEKVEDSREREMVQLALQEQAARKDAERRESMGAAAADNETPQGEVEASPARRKESASASATPQIERKASSSLPQSPVVRHRESVDVPQPKSPVKSNFGLTSAWTSGSGGEAAIENQGLSLGDQSVLDLSDIVADEPEEVQMDLDEEEGQAQTKAEPIKETIHSKPVVWSGNITNPSVEGFKAVPMSARLVVRPTFNPQWDTLLPHETIAISGRVPVPASLKFLSEIRMMPAKDSLTVVFTTTESATEEDKAGWKSLIDFHMQKGRHAIYHPYGTHLNVPYHGARELYLIPMLPGDTAPEFTDLLNDFSLPADRDGPILLGVFVGEKKQLHAPTSSPAAPPLPSASPSNAAGSASAAPSLPNAKLQELMASLNPAALQALTGSQSPAAPIAPQPQPQPQQQAYPPYQQGYQQQSSYDAYSTHQGGSHSPYPPLNNDHQHQQGYHNNQPYGGNHYGSYTPDYGRPHPQQGGRGGHTPSWGGPRQQHQYDRNQNRDDGWNSRGSGRRY